jgi:hypothetical protein
VRGQSSLLGRARSGARWALVWGLAMSCAPASHYESPDSMRGYDILITGHDSLASALAAGLRRRGFTVRDRVRGGSGATATLLLFTFQETALPALPALTWLHLELADTRTGAVVAAVAAPLDSLGATPAARAAALVDSLAAQAARGRLAAPT